MQLNFMTLKSKCWNKKLLSNWRMKYIHSHLSKAFISGTTLLYKIYIFDELPENYANSSICN